MVINEQLVAALIAEQFPAWVNLPIRAVKQSGWDNRTFHLGDTMTIRLPSAEEYAPQILKEFECLPQLAPHITTCKITHPLALGKPSNLYPWYWTINSWLEGECASVDTIHDLVQFAQDLGSFLRELHTISTHGGPLPGPHNFYRGGTLSVYHSEVTAALSQINDQQERHIAERLWADALSSCWQEEPVWVHGDIAVGNILVERGELNALIDFGQLAIGDPACDLVIAWTLFSGPSRDKFRQVLALDRDTWVRALAWTLWKTLCWPVKGTPVRRILEAIYFDYQAL